MEYYYELEQHLDRLGNYLKVCRDLDNAHDLCLGFLSPVRNDI